MTFALNRRNRRDCKGGHQQNSRTSEYDERKRGWGRCECPIFVSGTLQGTFKRQNTGRWQWEDARPLAITYEQAGNWERQVSPAIVLLGYSVEPEFCASSSEFTAVVVPQALVSLLVFEGVKDRWTH